MNEQTGSGFIKAAREGGEGEYEIQLPNNHVNAAETQPRSYKSNPATNDWVPNSDEHQVKRKEISIDTSIYYVCIMLN